MGVTGTRATVGSAAESLVARTREVTDLPVCVGLGISNGDQAAEVGEFADGVIVGSALVRTLVDAATPDEGIDRLRDLVADLAAGVRRSRERVATS
jgi:tryptophan synthase alpha chain